MAYGAKEKRHLKYLCELPCMFCEIEPCNNAHHVRSGLLPGTGMKSSMKMCIPVCHICHDKIHARMGERPFYKMHGYSVEDIHRICDFFFEQSSMGTYSPEYARKLGTN